jgi:hypothetical protein
MAPWRQGIGRRTVRASAAALFGMAVLAAGCSLWGSTPSCSWPLRVRGHATSEQAGLIRCYLRALAHHDAAGLRAVAYNDTNRTVRITAKDFRHAADAAPAWPRRRAGLKATTTPTR